MSDEWSEKLERMCADGRISMEDADEVRTFAAFLEAAGPPGTLKAAQAWRDHYPEDYARAVAERAARLDRATKENNRL